MHKHVLTRKGLALLGKKEAELANPNITKVVAGAGFADWDSLEELTEVLEPIAEMEIGEKQLVDGKTVRLPVQLSNLELTETALIRQIGVYSLDPDEGEILYQVVQYDLPIPLPSYAANNGGVIVFGPELDILFQNSEAASAPLTPGFLVTAKQLQDEIEGLKRELGVALSNKVTGLSLEEPVELYVSTDGSDETGDGSKNRPFASMGRALNQAGRYVGNQAVSINVHGGTYRESWVKSIMGYYIRIMGVEGETPVFKPGPYTQGATFCAVSRAVDIAVSNITFDGENLPDCGGLSVGAAPFIVDRCTFRNFTGYALWAARGGIGRIRSSVFQNNPGVCIAVSEGAILQSEELSGSGNGVAARAKGSLMIRYAGNPGAATDKIEVENGQIWG